MFVAKMRAVGTIPAFATACESRLYRGQPGVSHPAVCITSASFKQDRRVVFPTRTGQRLNGVVNHQTITSAQASTVTSVTADSNSKELLEFSTWRGEQQIKSPKIDIAFFEGDVRGTVSLEGIYNI